MPRFKRIAFGLTPKYRDRFLTKYLAIASGVFFLASVGLIAGWALDHSRQSRAADYRAVGHAVFERNEATLACIYGCNHCADDLRQRLQNRRLCKCIVDSWKHRDQVIAAKTVLNLSTSHAGEALWLLGFKTPDKETAEEFSQFVLTVIPNEGSNFSPEIHDQTSTEHEAFISFVKTALVERSEQADRIMDQ